MINYNKENEILNRNYILKYVGQEKIFEKYTGLKIEFGVLYHSPFRNDNNPTCSFYYDYSNKLRLKDHAGFFHGDCFDAAAKKLNINANTRDGFKNLLEKIAQDFRIHKYANDEVYIQALYEEVVERKIGVRKAISIDYILREWDLRDKQFWFDRYKLPMKFIENNDVYPIAGAFVNNRLESDESELCYLYKFGDSIRLYYPYRAKRRFIVNKAVYQGLHNAKVAKFGINTKSYKDVLVIRMLSYNKFDIDAFAPPSENYIMKIDDYYNIKYSYQHIVSLYDFDYTGIRAANYIRHRYNIKPFFLTNGRFNTIDTRVKDISDFVEMYGIDKARDLIYRVIDKYEDYINAVDLYEYNNLQFLYQEWNQLKRTE